MVSLVAWSKISIGSRNPAKNIAKMATAFLHENSINKSDIGLLIHSGVYRINFRAEPAFAPNIQKYMGLGDDEISLQSKHVFSFDVLDGTCGPHHAIQTISDMFQYVNCKYAILVVSDEKPNSLHKSGDFSSCIICVFAKDGNFKLQKSKFWKIDRELPTTHASFNGKQHFLNPPSNLVNEQGVQDNNSFSSDSNLSSANKMIHFFNWVTGKKGTFEHIINDVNGKNSSLVWRINDA